MAGLSKSNFNHSPSMNGRAIEKQFQSQSKHEWPGQSNSETALSIQLVDAHNGRAKETQDRDCPFNQLMTISAGLL